MKVGVASVGVHHLQGRADLHCRPLGDVLQMVSIAASRHMGDLDKQAAAHQEDAVQQLAAQPEALGACAGAARPC